MSNTKSQYEAELGSELTDSDYMTLLFMSLEFPENSIEIQYQDFLHGTGSTVENYPLSKFIADNQ